MPITIPPAFDCILESNCEGLMLVNERSFHDIREIIMEFSLSGTQKIGESWPAFETIFTFYPQESAMPSRVGENLLFELIDFFIRNID